MTKHNTQVSRLVNPFDYFQRSGGLFSKPFKPKTYQPIFNESVLILTLSDFAAHMKKWGKILTFTCSSTQEFLGTEKLFLKNVYKSTQSSDTTLSISVDDRQSVIINGKSISYMETESIIHYEYGTLVTGIPPIYAMHHIQMQTIEQQLLTRCNKKVGLIILKMLLHLSSCLSCRLELMVELVNSTIFCHAQEKV